MHLKKFLYLILFFIANLTHAYPQLGKPLAPFRIAGNLYFIGNTYVASYLIVTKQGNILINSDYPTDVPMLKANIKKLGFNFKDTKILLINHAHVDHSGGSALIKDQTGAKYMVMDADVDVVQSGGKKDYQYGNSLDSDNFYEPTKVDKVLHDGDKIKLGDTELTAHLTAGHTKGCTTWTMQVENKKYNVVIVGGPFVNQNADLIHNKAYPRIAEDYKHQFQILKSLPCDIFLGAHGMYFDLEKKYALMKQNKNNPFIDPDGYKKFIAVKEKDFYDELAKQNN